MRNDNKRYKVLVQRVEEWPTIDRCVTKFNYILYDNLHSRKTLVPKNWTAQDYCRYLNGILDDRDIYIKEIIAYAG